MLECNNFNPDRDTAKLNSSEEELKALYKQLFGQDNITGHPQNSEYKQKVKYMPGILEDIKDFSIFWGVVLGIIGGLGYGIFIFLDGSRRGNIWDVLFMGILPAIVGGIVIYIAVRIIISVLLHIIKGIYTLANPGIRPSSEKPRDTNARTADSARTAKSSSTYDADEAARNRLARSIGNYRAPGTSTTLNDEVRKMFRR